MSAYTRTGIKREVFAKILQNEVDRRGGIAPRLLSQYHHGGYAASLADEIAASGQMGLNAARRRVYSILNPEYANRNGKTVTQKVVDFDTADKILTALDLNYLWHTEPELAAAVIEPPTSCSECGIGHSRRTVGCKRCSDRFALRRRRAKRALATGPGLGGLSASPSSGGTKQGHKSLKEAA